MFGLSETKDPVNSAPLAMFCNKRQRRFPTVCHSENKIQADALPGRQADALPERDDRIEYGASGVGKGRSIQHGRRARRRLPAADKPGAIRFAGNDVRQAVLTGQKMQEPWRPFSFRAGAPPAEKRRIYELSLHKQITEDWMCQVRPGRRQYDFGVAC